MNDANRRGATVAQFAKLYGFALPVFLAIDMVWLGLVAPGFYRSQIGHLLSPKVNWVAAGLFYLVFVAGIIMFAVLPAIEKGSFARAALLGGLFGLMTYATYDMTNLATIRDWPVLVTVVDIAWGVVLCTLVSVSCFGFAKWLG